MRILPPDATHTHGSAAFDEYRRRLRRQRRFTNGETEPTKDERRRRRDSAEQRGLGCGPKVGTVWVRQDGRREHHPCLRCSRLWSCRTHAAALRAARARSSSPVPPSPPRGVFRRTTGIPVLIGVRPANTPRPRATPGTAVPRLRSIPCPSRSLPQDRTCRP